MTRLKPKTGDAAVLAGPNASSRLRNCYAQGRTVKFKFTQILVCLFLFSFHKIWAQQISLPPFGHYLYSGNCFTGQEHGGDVTVMDAVDSRNGFLHTPKGSLKVLIIFAGFTNDNVVGAPRNSANDPDWPQIDADHPDWGTAFPTNLTDKYGYTDDSHFNINKTDNSLSNFYYQMSKEQFKLTFGYFPDRINLTYNPSKTTWEAYERIVLDSAIAKSQTPKY